MIPKIIHYCWFGRGEMPKSYKKNIESWKKFCPDYEFICWDEDRFDVSSIEYVKRAYEMKKYAFVSDYVRLHALYECGGVYLDTDVELFKPLDRFLEHSFFMGRDRQSRSNLAEEVGTGLIGSEKGHPWLKEILGYYESDQLLLSDGTIHLKTINWVMTVDAFSRLDFKFDNVVQTLTNGVCIYPTEFFSPMDHATRRIYATKNTYAVHKYAGSWTKKRSLRRRLKYKVEASLGDKGLWATKDYIYRVLGKKVYS